MIISFACLAVIGYSLMPRVKVQLQPGASGPGLALFFAWPNTAPRIVEHEVTSRLEGAVQFVAGVRRISSVSGYGYGRIDVAFEKTADLDAARFEIAMLIRRSYPKLPAGVSYPELSYSRSGQTSPLVSYNLLAAAPPFALREYCEQRIVPALGRLEGVDKVVVYGASPNEWEITFDAQAVKSLGLDGDAIAGALRTYYRRAFVGKAKLPDGRGGPAREADLVFRLAGDAPATLEDVPLGKRGDRVIYLRDVARVRFQEQAPGAYYRVNGLNTVSVVAYAQKDANVLDVAGRLEEHVAALRAGLPDGYALHPAYDATTHLRQELADKGWRTGLSFVLMLAVVLAAYRSFRLVLLLLVSVLVNLALTSLAGYALGLEMHLYSFAGVAVSVMLMTNHALVMHGHLAGAGNRRVVRVMLAVAVVGAGAVGTLSLLDEKQRQSLFDFLAVVSLSLFTSAGVAWLLVPALAEKLGIAGPAAPLPFRRRRSRSWRTHRYRQWMVRGRRLRWAVVAAVGFAFGLPVHWLPEKMEGGGRWAALYNQSLGGRAFAECRPLLEKALGGTLQLFSDRVYEDALFPESTRTTVMVNARMPEGATLEQLNEVTRKVEGFLGQFDQVETFQTSVAGPQHASIAVYFAPGAEKTGFPYALKTRLEALAMGFGGVDWNIYGVGQSFSNAVNAAYKNNQIIVHGYNYDKLYGYAAALRQKMSRNPRVAGVDIEGSDNWEEHARTEYAFRKDSTRLALYGFELAKLYAYLTREAYRQPVGSFYLNGKYQPVRVVAGDYRQFNVWRFNNHPIPAGTKPFRAAQLGKITKGKSGNAIYKTDQQYQLVVAYNFIGSPQAAQKAKAEYTAEMEKMLPVGYKVYHKATGHWEKGSRTPYYLLLLLAGLVYCTGCVLFESFTQPLAVLLLIPFAFTGVFITFSLLDLNFDQGAYAAFVLLCVLAVVPALYLVNDLNGYRGAADRKHFAARLARACNHNLKGGLLSLLATLAGLSPFVLHQAKDTFWFAFAACLMSGLLFATVGAGVLLPLVLGKRRTA